jgi:hypothetical protein
MKKILFLFLFLLSVVSAVSAQNSKVKNNPVGKWQFEAPYAPEGFTSGTMEIGFAEAKYSAAMVFTGSDFKLPGEQVKFENEILKFVIYVEGTDVTVTLKFDSESKMSGKAVYSEGEVPLSLTRLPKKE